jgi:hypothetical protein
MGDEFDAFVESVERLVLALEDAEEGTAEAKLRDGLKAALDDYYQHGR